MPEVWLIFKDENHEVFQGKDLYLDIRTLDDPRFNKAAKSQGLPELFDFTGYDEDTWNDMMEATPPEYREPWKPEMDSYFDCDQGLAWCDFLEAYLKKNRDKLDTNWDQYSESMKSLEEFREKLNLGKQAGVNFRLVFGT